MGNFLYTFLNLLLQALSWAILIRVLLSWIPGLNQDNPLVRILRQVTDPILEPARRFIPPIGGLDLSPVIVLLLLQLLGSLLRQVF